MPRSVWSLSLAGTALVSAGALVFATPAINANAAPAPMPNLTVASPAIALLSNGHGYGYGHDDHDDDDDYYYGYGYDDSHADGDDDGHGWGGFGGIGSFITDFLANNQDEVLSVTAMIPTFYLGPVAVGNSLLANAYYNGYEGSATGVQGVLAYVTGQFGAPQGDLVQTVVLGLTSMVPQFNIGPVAVGNSLLATAYFSGYNGSATGLPGVISYVSDQLGLQAAPAAAAVAAAPVAESAAVAAASEPVSVPRSAASQAAPVAEVAGGTASNDSDAVVAAATGAVAEEVSAVGAGKADPAGAGRSAGRGAASAKGGDTDGSGKARAARAGWSARR